MAAEGHPRHEGTSPGQPIAPGALRPWALPLRTASVHGAYYLRVAALGESDRVLLGLIREGKVDAELAVRLGCTREEVRRRIERLFALAGVSDRASLRAWEPPAVLLEVPTEPLVESEPVSPPRAARWRPTLGAGVAVCAMIAAVAGIGWWWIARPPAERTPPIQASPGVQAARVTLPGAPTVVSRGSAG